MRADEILAMKAGRELNIRVAEDIMGCKFMEDEIFGDTEGYNLFMGEASLTDSVIIYGPLRSYSEDISAAQQVVDKLEDYSLRVEFNHFTENWEAEFSREQVDSGSPLASAPTVPEAICKAALLTMAEVQK